MHHKRKFMVGGFTALGGWLAIASMAYACTYFVGTFTVTDTTRNVSVTAVGCDKAPANGGTATMTNHITPTSPVDMRRGDGITLTTGSTTAATGVTYCGGSVPGGEALPSGTYDVAMLNPGYDTWGDTWGVASSGNPACMQDARFPTTNNKVVSTVLSTSVTVNSSGAITGGAPTALPTNVLSPNLNGMDASRGPTYAAMCIQTHGSAAPQVGNQLPIHLL